MLLVLLAAIYTAPTSKASNNKSKLVHNYRVSIERHIQHTWYLQDKVGTPRRRTNHADRHTRSIAYLRWINRSWIHSQRIAQRDVNSVPHISIWLCIHSYEAQDWFNRDTGHNGHYGGLQMHYDWGYGIVGYAYNYSELQQMQAAERGYKANGYSTAWLLGQWYHPGCV